MTDQDAWDIYFAGIASIRYHPKNDETDATETHALRIHRCALIADLMLKERTRRTCHGYQLPEP